MIKIWIESNGEILHVAACSTDQREMDAAIAGVKAVREKDYHGRGDIYYTIRSKV